MRNLDLNDPEVILLRDFEREDRDDSRSLRWSLLAAVVFHALVLAIALPAAEVVDPKRDRSCVLIDQSGVYARPVEPLVVPKPIEPRGCRLRLDSSLTSSEMPIPIPDPAWPPRQDRPASTRDLDVAPRLTTSEEPDWTEIARKVRVQGEVILEVLIREDGTVTDAKVLKSLPFGLAESAVESVLRWRYAPIEHKGRPVALRHLVTVLFQHDQSNCPQGPIASLTHRSLAVEGRPTLLIGDTSRVARGGTWRLSGRNVVRPIERGPNAGTSRTFPQIDLAKELDHVRLFHPTANPPTSLPDVDRGVLVRLACRRPAQSDHRTDRSCVTRCLGPDR